MTDSPQVPTGRRGKVGKGRHSTADSKGRKVIRPPNGGALIPGAGGGPQPGAGRPTNELRHKLTTVLDKGVPVLDQIAQGQVVNRRRFKVADLLPHVALNCPNCGEHDLKEKLDLSLLDLEYGMYMTIEIMESASAKERIAALALAGDFGPGKVKQVSTDTVREKVRETLQIVREALTPEQYLPIHERLRELWTGDRAVA